MKQVRYFGTDGAERVRAVRHLAEKLARTMAEEGKLEEQELQKLAPLFPRWTGKETYREGALVRTREGLYRLSGGDGKEHPGGKNSGWKRLGGGR